MEVAQGQAREPFITRTWLIAAALGAALFVALLTMIYSISPEGAGPSRDKTPRDAMERVNPPNGTPRAPD